MIWDNYMQLLRWWQSDATELLLQMTQENAILLPLPTFNGEKIAGKW